MSSLDLIALLHMFRREKFDKTNVDFNLLERRGYIFRAQGTLWFVSEEGRKLIDNILKGLR